MINETVAGSIIGHHYISISLAISGHPTATEPAARFQIPSNLDNDRRAFRSGR